MFNVYVRLDGGTQPMRVCRCDSVASLLEVIGALAGSADCRPLFLLKLPPAPDDPAPAVDPWPEEVK